MHEDGAIVLFDFEAVFLSMMQSYLLTALEGIGVPASVLNFVKAIYDQNRCAISVGGGSFEGFAMGAGIRQGCPLSLLLFALTADLLLRTISRSLPTSLVRAFADDTAVVMQALMRDSALLDNIFMEFGHASGLHLNLQKCIIIPVGRHSHDSIVLSLQSSSARWTRMTFADWGRYLGFAIGPGRDRHQWASALGKYEQRAHQWARLGLVCNTTQQCMRPT